MIIIEHFQPNNNNIYYLINNNINNNNVGASVLTWFDIAFVQFSGNTPWSMLQHIVYYEAMVRARIRIRIRCELGFRLMAGFNVRVEQ